MKSDTKSATEIFLPAGNYNLAMTLDSGQVFRWQEQGDFWIGVIGKNRVRLKQEPDGIFAKADAPVENWNWLRNFLQTNIDLEKILKTFPDDDPMNQAVAACRGLRVLRQEPWECLASFILSATKQIIQIRQIVAQLCACFGDPLAPDTSCAAPLGFPNHLNFTFPTAERIAALTEAELRSCKMGFRAPHLLGAARHIAEGKLDLTKLRPMPCLEARSELMKLRGVGEKIANCVLLFAYGFDAAVPVDVWIERAVQTLYFPRRRANKKKLMHFAATHFGPHGGHAQQYIFHYLRIIKERNRQ